MQHGTRVWKWLAPGVMGLVMAIPVLPARGADKAEDRPARRADGEKKRDGQGANERPRKDNVERPGRGAEARGGEARGGGPQMMIDHLKDAIKDLNLTDEQKPKVEEILKKASGEIEKLGQEKGAEPRQRMQKFMEIRRGAIEDLKAVLNEQQQQTLQEKLPQPRDMAAGMVERLHEAVGKLDLTAEQKDQVKTALQDARTKFQAARGDGERGDPKAMREKMRPIMDELRETMRQILTPEQQETLRKSMQEGNDGPPPPADRAQGDRGKRGRDRGVERPDGDRPGADRPDGDRPGTRRPEGDRPGARPDGDRPGASPKGDGPGARPEGDRPGARPDGDRPGSGAAESPRRDRGEKDRPAPPQVPDADN